MNSFKDKVYKTVSKIPKGKTLTYKEVARKAGRPNAYRAVGNILNKNRNSEIPCHRVIRSDGSFGGYRDGKNKKKKLLEREKRAALGLEKGKVKLSPHNPEWLNAFKKEKEMIKKALRGIIVNIEHVGSTAILGISSKPIIDIAMALSGISKEEIKKIHQPLEKIGYDYRGKNLPRERLFVKGDKEKRRYHLHIVKFNSKAWKNYIFFRNYLRAHKETAAEYAKLKLELAEKFPDNRKLYTAGKDAFIRKILKKS